MDKSQSLKNKTFIGFFWLLSSKLSTAIIQILILSVLSRIISVNSFGIVQTVYIIVGFAQIINQIGIGPALIQLKSLTEKHINAGFSFSMILGGLMSTIVFISSGLFADFFNIPELNLILKIISIIFILESYTTVTSSILQREMNLKKISLINLYSYILGYGVLSLILAYIGLDYWSLIISTLFQSLFKAIMYYFAKPIKYKLIFDYKSFKDLFHFAGGYSLGKISTYFATQSDNLITSKFLGVSDLGIYSRAYAVMSSPASMIGDALNMALFPAMSARQNDIIKLREVFIEGSKMILYPSILLTFIIVSSAQEIVYILLGNKWEECIIPLKILGISLFCRLGYKLGSEISKATGNTNKQAIYSFFYALSSIIGSLIGVNWGVNGVAIGTIFAIFINYVLLTNLGLSIIKLNFFEFIKKIYLDVIIVVLIGSLFILINDMIRKFDFTPLITFIFSNVLFSFLVFSLVYFFGKKLSFFKLIPYNNLIAKYLR